MNVAIQSEPSPLRETADGVLCVGGSRVPLDTVVAAFGEGLTAEEILQQYPSLELPDIYAVIGYYLRHREEVAAYLEQRRRCAETVRAENERRFDIQGFRERLLSRRSPG
jgi:uncharacterized protein (DUF433 family)